jgi:alanyl-tRNA synthetase
LDAGAEGFAVFESTPFYAESGGQVGDRGVLTEGTSIAQVGDTFKQGKVILHRVRVSEGKLQVGKEYRLEVDEKTRQLTAINHTATHLLHAALRKVIGDRVKQAGSLVEPNRLRFDFTFPRPLTEAELFEIETMINGAIRQSHAVNVQEMAYDDAIRSGALAFFDEKYGDRVRVVRVGEPTDPFSVELCGGTHLDDISTIGFFKILSESSVASGVRRIEAVTSEAALQYLVERNRLLDELEDRLGTKNEALLKKVDQLVADLKSLQRENEKLQVKAAQAGARQGGDGGQALWDKKFAVNELQVVLETVPSVNAKVLRTLVDQARDKLKERAIVVLASESEGKVALCMGLTKDLLEKLDAGKLIQPLAKDLGGTGGGRADFAQAGGTRADRVGEAFANFKEWLKTNT